MGLDILAFVVPIILILVVVVIFLSFVPLGLWISAISAGVKVSIFSLVGMRLRRVRADKIIRPLIKAQKAGMNVNANQLESHLLSGGPCMLNDRTGIDFRRCTDKTKYASRFLKDFHAT